MPKGCRQISKVRNGSQKWLHRRVCQALLPASVLKRKKTGVAVNVVDDGSVAQRARK